MRALRVGWFAVEVRHRSESTTEITACEPHVKRPTSITLRFALASYAVVVTGTTLACAVWLPAFEVPSGTPSYQPMGQTFNCFVIGAATDGRERGRSRTGTQLVNVASVAASSSSRRASAARDYP